MEFDLTPDLGDEKLFNGVLDDTDPWGSFPQKMDGDFSGLLEDDFSADDFMSQLPEDLELPMLHDGDILASALEGVPLDDPHCSDSSDSGVECVIVKSEPLSPTMSHCSEVSQDSAHSGLSLYSNSPADGITVIKHEIPDIVNISAARSAMTALPVNSSNTGGGMSFGNHGNGVSIIKIENAGTLTPPLTPTTASSIISSAASVTTSNGPIPMKMMTVKGEGGNLVKMLVPVNSQVRPETLSAASSTMTTKCSVNHVLAGKPKVIPKPPAPVQLKPTNVTQGASKTLVLTPEEFAKLTSQKLLNLKGGTTLQPIVTSTNQNAVFNKSIRSPVTPVTPISPGMTCLPHTDSDVKSIKRQQRMMKNRESACLSRKRKKEYMSTLEQRLKVFNDENSKLKVENNKLRKTINILQIENDKLKKGGPSTTVKGTTILLGVLLLVSLNLTPFMSILGGSRSPNVADQELRQAITAGSVHHGRTLMSYNNGNSQNDEPRDQNINPLDIDWTNLEKSLHLQREDLPQTGGRSREWSSPHTGLSLAKRLEALTRPSVCPTYFNSTESLRLLNDLRGWVKGHEELLKRDQEVKQQKHDTKKENVKKKVHRRPKKYLSPQKLRGATSGATSGADLQKHVDYRASDAQGQGYAVQMFTGAEQQYQSFMKSLQRRNDTFYVVSFRKDHLLLPATSHNKTMRPRMSVVMPAMGLNETMSHEDGSITMMQIDCEVTATKLVHIHKSVVPDYLDPNVTQPHPTMQHEQYHRKMPNEQYLRPGN